MERERQNSKQKMQPNGTKPAEPAAPKRTGFRSVAPPKHFSGYSRAKHSTVGTRTGLSGDMTLKPGVPAYIVRPRYTGGSLIFRPLPAIDPYDTSKFQPYRLSTDPYGVTDFIRDYKAVRGLGDPDGERYTFILCDPVALREGTYDLGTNPYWILHNTVYRAVKKEKNFPEYPGVRPGDWLRYIDEDGGNTPLLPKPKALYFIQALIFKNHTELYVTGNAVPRGLGPNDVAQIVQLPASAGMALDKLLAEVNPGYEDYEGPDWESAMVYGDPVHPDHGRFITVYNPKSELVADLSELDDYRRPVRQGPALRRDGRSEEIAGYKVSIDDVLIINGNRTKITPKLHADDIPAIMSKMVWFDDVIHIPTHEEICLYCARALRRYPHILDFGWQEYPEFFTEEVRKILRDTKTFQMPAGLPATPGRSAKAGKDAPPSDFEQDLDEEPDLGEEVEPVEEVEVEGDDALDEATSAPARRAPSGLDDLPFEADSQDDYEDDADADVSAEPETLQENLRSVGRKASEAEDQLVEEEEVDVPEPGPDEEAVIRRALEAARQRAARRTPPAAPAPGSGKGVLRQAPDTKRRR